MLANDSSRLRAALLAASFCAPLSVGACANQPSGPGPQEASFPSGERVTSANDVELELQQAHYDRTGVVLTVTLRNRRNHALTVQAQGVMLSFGPLEYPLAHTVPPELADGELELPPSGSEQLALGFRLDQALVEAGTLHLYSLSDKEAGPLDPLEIVIPPPAAYVEATQPEDHELATPPE